GLAAAETGYVRTAAAAALAFAKSETAAVAASLADLKSEHAELLEFANARDSEASEKIAALEKRIAELEAAPPGSAAEKFAQDVARERTALAEKLAETEAALASASRPLEADAAAAKRYADEALEALRAALLSEKKRNEEERTASVARQKEFHDRISALERALRTEPGAKTPAELMIERADREIARLRGQLDSEKALHKADSERAEKSEAALQNRLNAMQQRESAVREQLLRVEKRTADYDSLSSQLRRREEELVEAERQFGEARLQWQAVEKMLKARIGELEHGAGDLFDSAPSESRPI
ncbi:MAG: hypothetical protein IJ783_03580, partial [Kiritimatiellae bacterium]|nr:hypothetical protein [Kiritimatiellia bacterium]